MRSLLLAGAAAAALIVPGLAVYAADLPTKAPPAPAYFPPPAFSWTGFYFGGNIGGGWASTNITTPTGGSFGSNSQGAFIGGGQVGFNYQVGPNIVLGAEWFIDGIASNNNNLNNGTVVAIPGVGNFGATAQANWISTATGRIGITGPGWDHWLLYAKGGGGWAQDQANVSNLTTGFTVNTTRTNSGWVAGAGIEWAFAPSWTAKLEYQYLGLNSWTVGPGVLAQPFNVNNSNVQMVTVGVNYLFNWGAPSPVAARY